MIRLLPICLTVLSLAACRSPLTASNPSASPSPEPPINIQSSAPDVYASPPALASPSSSISASVKPNSSANASSTISNSAAKSSDSTWESIINSTPSTSSDSSSIASASTSSGGSGFSSLSSETESLTSALNDLGAETVGSEIRIDLPADILFDFDKFNIRPDAAAALNKLLVIIQAQAPNNPIRIAGHTDAVGSDAYNQTLSENRAKSVKTWLADKGITATRMTTQGFGETLPIAANTKPDGSDNPQGRQKNRRVQVVIRTNS